MLAWIGGGGFPPPVITSLASSGGPAGFGGALSSSSLIVASFYPKREQPKADLNGESDAGAVEPLEHRLQELGVAVVVVSDLVC